MLQHPEITWIEETGYPSWMQKHLGREDDDDEEYTEDDVYDDQCDRLYEERRDRERLGLGD